MSKDISLGKLTAIYTAGNIVSKVISFALFFLYTFFLTKEDIGYFDLIVSTIALLSPILNLQIYDALLRWLIQDHTPSKSEKVITNSIFILILGTIISIFILGVLGFFFDIDHYILIFLLILSNTAYPVIQYIARGLGRNNVYVLSGILYSSIFTISTFISLYYFDLKVEGLLFSNILAIAITILFLVERIGLIKYVRLAYIDKALMTEMVAFSIPLLPNTFGWWAISMANRYIIVLFLGIGANGVFALAMKFPSILMMLTNIFYMAWQEKAMKYYEAENRNEYYTEVLKKYCNILFCFLIILIAFTKPALKYIVASSYYETWKFLPILYLAIGYQSLAGFYGTGYLSSRDTIGALSTTLVGSVLTIGAGFLLIPSFGLIGASSAVLIGYVFLFLYRIYDTKKYFSITFPVNKVLLLNAFLILTSIITISENIYILYSNALFSLILTYIVNHEIIHQFALKFSLRLQS